MTVGIITKKKNIDEIKKGYTYLAAAKMEGVRAFTFHLNDVNLENKKIYGYEYINGKHIKKEFNYPDIIHNMPTVSNEKQKAVFKEMIKTVPYTVKYVGKKKQVYKYIKRYKNLRKYLIPTETLTLNSIYFINKHNKIVLKPNKGSKGRGIFFLFKKGNYYELIENKNKKIISKVELVKLIKKLEEEKYLIQRYIECKTKSGNTYDVRAFVQKTNKKNWIVTYMYARVAPNEILTSNIHTGGAAIKIKRFAKKELNKDIIEKLNDFSIEIAKAVDNERKNKLIEIGIDIGIDKKGKLWLFEINSRPGFPTISRGNINAAKNTMKYIKSLEKN